jgi:DNA replication protein DnaC
MSTDFQLTDSIQSEENEVRRLQREALASAIGSQRDFSKLQALLDDDAYWERHDAVVAKLKEKQAAAVAAKTRTSHSKRWDEIPPQYTQEFVFSKSRLSRPQFEALKHWQPNGKTGIGLMSPSGHGKTLAFCRLILRRLTCTWLFLPMYRFANAVRDQYDNDVRTSHDAEQLIKDAMSVRVLLLDDLGDESPSEAVSEALKGLVESRTSRHLPILWTCNITEQAMAARHKGRGGAIVRRLKEFSILP